MSFFSKLFGTDKTQAVNQVKEDDSRAESAVGLKDDGELVAVIMAAVMNMLSTNISSDLRIKSIRRVGRTSPIWNIAGRDEYVASKL